MTTRKQKNQGMNWIRPEKRLAIYQRDGLACIYCGDGIEDGAKLTLDHITPYSRGGGHTPDNLVTACHECNSVRGDKSLKAWLGYCNTGAGKRVCAAVRREIDVAAAKTLIARRGGFTAALNS